MRNGQLTPVLYQISRLAVGRETRQQADRDLLGRFVADQDQAAFTALVERHGPMVLSVCRRVLPHIHDAEDACQAAFLVLARKAASIRKRDSLASWLHGVAYRSALSLKRQLARNHGRETPLADVPQTETADDLTWREIMSALDAELDRLPERLRAPLVLCYLQGKTRDEAAQELGWPVPTLRGRLDRGRRVLRNRLTRRGLALAAALLAPALARPAMAAVSAARVISTVKAATLVAAGQTVLPGLIPAKVSLAMEGVAKAMFVSQMKIVALVVLTVGILGAGAGTLTYCPQAAESQQALNAADPPLPLAQDADTQKPQADEGETWREVRRFANLASTEPRQPWSVYTVAFSPDGNLLAAAGDDGQITLWDLATGNVVAKLVGRPDPSKDQTIRSIQFSRDGKRLASAGEGVMVWDLATRRPSVFQEPHRVLSVAFSPDGRVVASASSDQQVRLLDVQSGQIRFSSQAPELGGGVAFSPDGKLVAGTSTDRTVRLWDAQTGKEVRQVGTPKRAGISLTNASAAFSPDGKTLASASNDMTVRLWDVVTGKQVASLNGHKGVVLSLAFSPDGKTLASAGMDKIVICWDFASGTIKAKLAGHTGHVHSVAFSPDGRYLASAGDDGNVSLWVRSGTSVPTANRAKAADPTVAGDRLEKLVQELVKSRKSDGEAVEALYLATLARFPAETEKQFAANFVGSKNNREEALKDLLFALTNTKEFNARLEELRIRTPGPRH